MSGVVKALSDDWTMFQRIVKRTMHNPTALISAFALPVITVLLFNYVFGGALQTHGVKYINYAMPGIFLINAISSAQAVAIAVGTDVKEGIMDRFRSMAINRASVLTGHVLGNTVRTLAAAVIVALVGLVIGFRPNADLVEWLATIALLILLLVATSWLSIAVGLAMKAPDAAVNAMIVFLLLPYISSAFVPTDTMPGWLQAFANHQPMTPICQTMRGLLSGTPIGHDGLWAIIWCAGITLVSYVWASYTFRRSI
jgi:ABC-2 type transport system permease protein